MEYCGPLTFGERPSRRTFVGIGPETAGFVLDIFLPVVYSFIIITFSLKQSHDYRHPKMNEWKRYVDTPNTYMD